MLSPVFKISARLGGTRSIGLRNAQPKARFEPSELPDLGSREEALLVDERSELRPAQVIESKLTHLLRNSSLPTSLLLMRSMLRTR